MALETLDVAVTSASCGGATYLATIVANRQDIAWLKQRCKELAREIADLRRRVDTIHDTPQRCK